MSHRFSKYLVLLLGFLFIFSSCGGDNASNASENEKEQEEIDVKEIIFHHLGDGYGWEVPFMHQYRIPLPVIVRAQDKTWHCFSSSKLTELEAAVDPATGKEHHELVAVPYTIEKGDKSYTFILAHGGNHSGKVVELTPLEEGELPAAKAAVESAAKEEGAAYNSSGTPTDVVYAPDFVYIPADKWEGVKGGYYRDYKPMDFSITKNVMALIISVIVVLLLILPLARHYKRKGMKAPRKGLGLIELAVDFIYGGVIKPTLGAKAKRYAPYLLTCFFFIFVMNLLGLIVIFPGGANLTGNIAITMVLAILTFLMTNIRATKHYWKEIFWPDVPVWLKCPIPIMQFIELFGIFTKPAALCVRLFANMMGGHMIVLTLTVLIFIFAAFGAAALGGVTVISLAFSIFMLALDVLVSFIQAYVFTMLSTIFIGLAQDEGHHSKEHAEQILDNLKESHGLGGKAQSAQPAALTPEDDARLA